VEEPPAAEPEKAAPRGEDGGGGHGVLWRVFLCELGLRKFGCFFFNREGCKQPIWLLFA
jgi:hypothetical protein